MRRHHCIFGLLGLALGTACSLEPAGHTAFGDAGAGETSSGQPADSGEADGEAGSAPGDTTAAPESSGDGPAESSGDAGSTSEGVDASAGSEGESTGPGDDGGSTTGGGSTTDGGTTSGGGNETDPGPEGGKVGDEPQTAGVCSGGGLPSVFTEAQASPELHIFGVYQGQGGAVTVTIDRVGIPLIVVLSSYEPVQWTLELAPGVDLDEVILNGYEEQAVMGQGAATVTDKSGIGSYLSACAYFWPDNNEGCETQLLVTNAEALTGADLASFTGCYEGVSFSLL
jgi:hypothetical protein